MPQEHKQEPASGGDQIVGSPRRQSGKSASVPSFRVGHLKTTQHNLMGSTSESARRSTEIRFCLKGTNDMMATTSVQVERAFATQLCCVLYPSLPQTGCSKCTTQCMSTHIVHFLASPFNHSRGELKLPRQLQCREFILLVRSSRFFVPHLCSAAVLCPCTFEVLQHEQGITVSLAFSFFQPVITEDCRTASARIPRL